jgi:hypothetical protein
MPQILNVQRLPLLLWEDLTEQERAEFNEMTEEDHAVEAFARYRGHTWATGEFSVLPTGSHTRELGWHGISVQSAFEGVVIRFHPEPEYVDMGQVLSLG